MRVGCNLYINSEYFLFITTIFWTSTLYSFNSNQGIDSSLCWRGHLLHLPFCRRGPEKGEIKADLKMHLKTDLKSTFKTAFKFAFKLAQSQAICPGKRTNEKLARTSNRGRWVAGSGGTIVAAAADCARTGVSNQSV